MMMVVNFSGKRMGMDLFEGAEGNEDISNIEINKEFALRFEHNKKREDLHRLDELKKHGMVQDADDSSEESDDDEEEVMADLCKTDLQFYDALVRVKKNDPVINQKDVKLFNSDDSDGEGNLVAKQKEVKERPLYLKDVVAKQLIENGHGAKENELTRHGKSYIEEQEEIKQAFLDATEAVDGEDENLFTEKKKAVEEDQDDEDIGVHKKLDEFFGEDGNLNENEMFLKSYFLNKMWIDEDQDKKLSQEKLQGFSEEEDELDEQDKYEVEYNFRFEEGAGDRVLGHSRFIEGSVRKKDNARKLQRKSKEERIAQKELERKEELKHLKNLKMKEIMEKLQKIKSIAGITDDKGFALDECDLEEDFDPEEYDRRMKETFNDLYYDEEDVDPHFGSDSNKNDDVGVLEKPDFDKEDEFLGLPKEWDICKPGDGFLATRERILKDKTDKEDAQPSDEHVEEEIMREEGKRKKKRRISLHNKVDIEKELEEYYKLDYEDTIGDLKTRFKYTSVSASRYGLTPEELLMLDDRDLNQYVSIKKLAPYHQREWKVSKQKRFQLKMNKKSLREKETKDSKNHKKKISKPIFQEQENIRLVDANGDAQPSRQKRRRQKQAELKISHQRSLAYVQAKDRNKQ